MSKSSFPPFTLFKSLIGCDTRNDVHELPRCDISMRHMGLAARAARHAYGTCLLLSSLLSSTTASLTLDTGELCILANSHDPWKWKIAIHSQFGQ